MQINFVITFPLGEQGCKMPAAAPDAPKPIPWASKRATEIEPVLDPKACDTKCSTQLLHHGFGSTFHNHTLTRRWYVRANPIIPAPTTTTLIVFAVLLSPDRRNSSGNIKKLIYLQIASEFSATGVG